MTHFLPSHHSYQGHPHLEAIGGGLPAPVLPDLGGATWAVGTAPGVSPRGAPKCGGWWFAPSLFQASLSLFRLQHWLEFTKSVVKQMRCKYQLCCGVAVQACPVLPSALCSALPREACLALEPPRKT